MFIKNQYGLYAQVLNTENLVVDKNLISQLDEIHTTSTFIPQYFLEDIGIIETLDEFITFLDEE
jgi:hypothetical protein